MNTTSLDPATSLPVAPNDKARVTEMWTNVLSGQLVRANAQIDLDFD